MKYILQLTLFLAMTPAVGVEPSTKFSAEHAEIKALCIKNANESVGDAAAREQVCECSITKTIEFVTSPNFKEKDPKVRLEWLKKMYALKLSQAEIDADPYDIFEFNLPITIECMKPKKLKK